MLIGEPTGGIDTEAGDIDRHPLKVDADLKVHRGHHIRQCHALTNVQLHVDGIRKSVPMSSRGPSAVFLDGDFTRRAT